MISIAILAGGQSRRMGQDKTFLEVAGQPVIERVIDRVQPLTDDLLISTNSPEKFRRFGLRLVGDVYPNKGVLGGIYSALRAARHLRTLVVACDMPFLNPNLLRYLSDLSLLADITVPVPTPPSPEPLCAVYSKTCLHPIEARLQTDQLQVSSLFDEVSVRYVYRDEIAQFDPDFYTFININTPDDWQRAQTLAQ